MNYILIHNEDLFWVKQPCKPGMLCGPETSSLSIILGMLLGLAGLVIAPCTINGLYLLFKAKKEENVILTTPKVRRFPLYPLILFLVSAGIMIWVLYDLITYEYFNAQVLPAIFIIGVLTAICMAIAGLIKQRRRKNIV